MCWHSVNRVIPLVFTTYVFSTHFLRESRRRRLLECRLQLTSRKVTAQHINYCCNASCLSSGLSMSLALTLVTSQACLCSARTSGYCETVNTKTESFESQ